MLSPYPSALLQFDCVTLSSLFIQPFLCFTCFRKTEIPMKLTIAITSLLLGTVFAEDRLIFLQIRDVRKGQLERLPSTAWESEAIDIKAMSKEKVSEYLVWRHGDRAPVRSYPTDIHQEGAWPHGWGELTELGMKQQYSLGRLIRQRYILGEQPFLSPRYKSKEVYIRSTDVNRTLVSAMSNLAGMYPVGIPGADYPRTKNASWPSNWTPIPVHTVELETDHIGNAFANCPRAQQLDNYIRSSKQFQKYASDNKEFFAFLTEKTGMPIDLTNVYLLNDVITIEKIYNMTQPEWLTEEVAARILNLTEVNNEFTYGISKPYVPEMIRLRGGTLLKAIVDKMNMKARCEADSQNADCQWIGSLKYYAYSAHDTTVAALLTTFGDEKEVIKGGMPKYTASVAVELWNRTDIGFAVKILFHSAFHHKYHPITRLTKGCPLDSDFCALDRFEKRSKKFMPADIELECKAKRDNRTKQTRINRH
ncbi:Lysosomal acid phosphatase [Toxocara canis]|uniref:Lysosomal acid phosphatase n=1 Tax=Toxocara canis TaxID=6265 RepID=A0A0B2VTY1_TOXCA|nr:Lysosomal acid phosphatase [Toxocara canis]